MKCKLCKKISAIDLVEYNSERYCQHPSQFQFNTKLKICSDCGFVFCDNVDIKKINLFYKNNIFYDHSIYKHYDIVKRVEVYKKNFNLKEIKLLEIGGGDNESLRNYLNKNQSTYHNSDLNDKYKNDNLLKNTKYDVVIDHMVLEHVIDIHEYFKRISNLLEEDGFYLTEVPDINKYSNSLLLFNALHLNHYNVNCIQILGGYYNLELKTVIKEPYSHYHGITYIFKKKSKIINKSHNNKDVDKITKIFDSGINFLENDKNTINEIVNKNNNKTILWGASEFLHLYFNKFEDNLLVVDINNGKEGKYKDIEIFNPIKINEIADQVELIVIMTPNKTAFENICKFINQNIYLDLQNTTITQIGQNKL